MDMQARARLASEIGRQQQTGGEIAVPLDLFFEGNDDLGSIGCNLGPDQPSIAEFYRKLRVLRAKPEVQDIWVRVVDADDESRWPFTDAVYVIASLPQEEVEAALRELNFSEVVASWMYGKPTATPEPRPGLTTYSIWWD